MDTTGQEILAHMVMIATTWGLNVVGALAVLIVGRMVAGWLRKISAAQMERARIDASLVGFLSSLAYYLVLAVVVIVVLNLFGIETTSLIAVLGTAGLAVGLAMQGTLSNVAAGVMLLIFRPFKLGDYVDVAGVAGSVGEIGIFATTLSTPDNVRVTVPNSAIFGQIIRNYSANDTRRNDMIIGIAYQDDIGKAIETIKKVIDADPRALKEPAAVIAVSELADSSVNLVVRPWCRKEDYWALRFDLTRRLKEELESAGVSIPFPQRDLHLFQEASAA